MIVPKDAEKAFGNIQYPFMIKSLHKLETGKNVNLIKDTLKKTNYKYRHTLFYRTSQILHCLQTEGLLPPCITLQPSLSEPLFQQHFLHFVSLSHFRKSCSNISNLCIVIIFVMTVCDW